MRSVAAVILGIVLGVIAGTAQSSARPGAILSDLNGVWVSNSNWVEPFTMRSESSRREFRIETGNGEVLIRETIESERGARVQSIRLRADGSGETNTIDNSATISGTVPSVTQFENGVLIRQVQLDRSWDPREFPSAIVEEYRLSKDKKKLFVTTVLSGVSAGPLPSIVTKPIKFTAEFRRER